MSTLGSPQFSILIPTRRRPRTLRAAIASVLAQDHPDFELVVMDNAATEETTAVVRSFASPKIVYDKSDELLPMWDNWERGLAQCRGDYVFVLGDDDALMPDGLRLGAQLLAQAEMDVLHWRKATYWWDDAIQERLRGFLFVQPGFELSIIDNRKLLTAYYAWRATLAELPCIYSSFVHRSVIARVKAKTGRFFAPCPPDVYSGIAHLVAAERIVQFERPLSLSGSSGASAGTAHFFRSKGEAERKRYYDEIGRAETALAHPELIPSSSLEMVCAEVQLMAKERLFPDDPTVVFQPRQLLAAMIANVNRDPPSYADARADVLAYAAKLGVPAGSLTIPAALPTPTGYVQGPVFKANGQLDQLAINARVAGIEDAHGAARLAAAVLPALSFGA